MEELSEFLRGEQGIIRTVAEQETQIRKLTAAAVAAPQVAKGRSDKEIAKRTNLAEIAIKKRV